MGAQTMSDPDFAEGWNGAICSLFQLLVGFTLSEAAVYI
jgi:hypothetical protein